MSKYNLDEIDEDKRDSGIPKEKLCRYGGLALGKSEHRTGGCRRGDVGAGK